MFPSCCGLLIHSESACVAVSEADNLKVLPVYGCHGACSCLVREYNSLGALGVLNASGRHRSTCSEMGVKAQVLLAIIFVRVPVPLRSGFPKRLVKGTSGLCAESESRFYQDCGSLRQVLQWWEGSFPCVCYRVKALQLHCIP